MPGSHNCPCCPELLSTENFTSHFQLNHKHVEMDRIPCCHCKRPFNDISGYYKHLKIKHSSNVDKIVPAMAKPSRQLRTCVGLHDSDGHELELTEASHNSNAEISPPVISNSAFLTPEVTANDGTDVTPDSEDFGPTIQNVIASFVAELYSHHNLSRKFVQDLIVKVEKLNDAILTNMLSRSAGSQWLRNFNTDRQIVKNIFSQFDTEYKSTKFFSNTNRLIPPYTKDITCILHSKRKQKKQKVVTVNTKIEIVSMESILMNFLQLPNVFRTILSHIEKCESSTEMISPVQGTRWKKIKAKFGNKRVFPIVISMDDFGINNPLGSHRNIHKLGAVYFSLPCIPDEYRSMLDNIFLVQIHNTKDYEQVGNKKIFSNLIQQLANLEKNGIIINIGGDEERVYFALLSLIGDNLAQNSILGFSASFNSTNCCRICRVDKESLKQQTVENEKIVRNRQTYEEDVKFTSNGVKEECIFNALTSYHVTENMSVDYMHDLYEGVCRYDTVRILNNLIKKHKFFDIKTLNWRITCFDHGSSYGENKPPLINDSALSKNSLITSASEMRTFIAHLGFYVGDLIPEGNDTWDLYLSLRKIIRIVSSSSLTAEMITDLQKYVSDHNSLFIKLFNETLKPKFHFLLHYTRILLSLGPLKFYSSMRFEGKHKPMKMIAKTTTSRVNPAHTVAFKHQQNLCYRFFNNVGFSAQLSWDPLIMNNLTSAEDFDDFKETIPLPLHINHSVPSWVSIYGTHYETGQCLTIECAGLNRKFGKIKYIIMALGVNITFVYKKMKTIRIWNHVQAYELDETNDWGYIEHELLVQHEPLNIYLMENNLNYVLLI